MSKTLDTAVEAVEKLIFDEMISYNTKKDAKMLTQTVLDAAGILVLPPDAEPKEGDIVQIHGQGQDRVIINWLSPAENNIPFAKGVNRVIAREGYKAVIHEVK